MTATDRITELDNQIDEKNEQIKSLKESRDVLVKEKRIIINEQHRKTMRKRKLAYITANMNRKGYLYGTKVRLMQHTRKSSRFAAGAWVARKADEPNSRKWVWFPYRDLGTNEPGSIAINRSIAGMFN